MKSLRFTLCILAATLASCQNDLLLQESQITESPFKATTEQYSAGTKTSLDNSGNVLWKTGDQMSIFVASTINEQYQVTDKSNGKTTAGLNKISSSSFSAGSELPTNIAYYPYNEDNEIAKNGASSYDLFVTLPATQTYAAGSFGNGSFPMVAVTESSTDMNLKFKNILGGLKLQLTGTVKVKSITITGKTNEILYGAATVTASNTSTPQYH